MKPMEVPFPPEKPEIKPTEEPPVKIWPVKTPEVIPGKEPERPKAPNEIPAPPESKNQIRSILRISNQNSYS